MLDPSEEEFITILQEATERFKIPYDKSCVDYLMDKYFRGVRPMRSCHPRDILQQLINIALYENRPPLMTKTDLDKSIDLYFTATHSEEIN